MVHFLGYQPTQWNTLAQHDDSRRFIERTINRHLQRRWMPELSSSQFKVYSFIIGRTLGWQKYAEAIPMSHFLDGMREADGSLYRMEDGEAACAGTGIRKDDTVRAAISVLREKGYVAVFEGKRGTATPANVYMPLSEHNLAIQLTKSSLGILPEHLSRYYVGEHVGQDGLIFKIIALREERLRVQEVDKWGNALGEAVFVCPSDIERLTFSDWRRFKSRSIEEV